jgi:GNAT superfamily N-acetyltransferase
MPNPSLIAHELTSIEDRYLYSWLDLFELSFEPGEKVLVSSILKVLRKKAQGDYGDHLLLAGLDPDGSFVGMSYQYLIENERTGIIWYMAVLPELRGKGFGASLYELTIQKCRELDYNGVFLEVEIPGLQKTQEKRVLAERRIGFYRRLGVRLLEGVEYWQEVGSHHPPTQMSLMFHPFNQPNPNQVYCLAKLIFKDSLSQTGNLRLS